MTEPEQPYPPLRCTRCGDQVNAVLAYTGSTWSEHRDVTGYECDTCPANWDKQGNPLPPMWTIHHPTPSPQDRALTDDEIRLLGKLHDAVKMQYPRTVIR